MGGIRDPESHEVFLHGPGGCIRIRRDDGLVDGVVVVLDGLPERAWGRVSEEPASQMDGRDG